MFAACKACSQGGMCSVVHWFYVRPCLVAVEKTSNFHVRLLRVSDFGVNSRVMAQWLPA